MPTDELSPNATKAIVMLYVAKHGFDGSRSQEWFLSRISGMTEEEARAAFLELADAGCISRDGMPPRGQG